MDLAEVEGLANSVNCSFGSMPFVYLGLRASKKMRGMDGWKDVIDRFSNRLSSERSKLLSIG